MTPIVRWRGQTDDPYAGVISQFMGREFPQLSSQTIEDTMEAVMSEWLTTKQFRLGPRPNVESQVMMRDVVREAMGQQKPIGVLIPVASVKVPIGESMDVAELSALRILGCLVKRVQEHYKFGMQMVIRLEDLTELAISGTDDLVTLSTETYKRQFKSLVKVLEYDSFIKVVAESEMADQREFLCNVDSVADLFYSYRRARDEQANHTMDTIEQELRFHGWKGGVSNAMYDYLDERYERLYPGVDAEVKQKIQARYLAAILVRKKLGATGAEHLPSPKRLELSFAQPLPDAPRVSTRIIYRSVPHSQTSQNAPFWNAKGYLRITEAGNIRIAFSTFDDLRDATVGQLTIENNDAKVTLRADYTLS